MPIATEKNPVHAVVGVAILVVLGWFVYTCAHEVPVKDLDVHLSYNVVSGSLELENKEDAVWSDCRVRINDTYDHRIKLIAPLSKMHMTIEWFSDDRGTVFNPLTQVIKSALVTCSRAPDSFRSAYLEWNR